MGMPRSRINPRRRRPSPVLLLLLAVLAAVPAAAETDGSALILPGLDPLLNGTRDARLLGVERLLLRGRILEQGPDPAVRRHRFHWESSPT